MNRVDFYILSDAMDIYRFACTLTNKAYTSHHKVTIRARDEQQAKTMDVLLWKYKDISFIPHALATDTIDDPVIISTKDIGLECDVIINLSDEIPNSSRGRIIEIIGNQTDKNKARSRWRQYEQQSYEIYDHKMNSH